MKNSFIVILFATILSGCMAAEVYAPLAGMANGVRDAKVTTTIDESTFTQETKNSLVHAKRLGIVSGDDTTVKVAEIFESRGGYNVKLSRTAVTTDKLLPSERKEALNKLCKENQNDLALIGYVTNTDHQNPAVGAVTGRVIMKQSWKMDVLMCRTKSSTSFSGAIETDAGGYNITGQELERKAGESIAGAILADLGFADKSASAGATSQTGVVNDSSPTQVSAALSANVVTLAQAQARLNDLGYQVGQSDGVMGRKTREQLKAFQQSRGIPQTGKLDALTIAELNKPI